MAWLPGGHSSPRAFGNFQRGELARKTTRISPPSMVVSSEEVSMHTITITLSDDRLVKLQEIAARLHISPEELARAGVEELLACPQETCQRAIDYVLKKNAELYRRL